MVFKRFSSMILFLGRQEGKIGGHNHKSWINVNKAAYSGCVGLWRCSLRHLRHYWRRRCKYRPSGAERSE